MSPQPRAGWVPGKWPSGMRDGAGLLLLFPVERRPHIVLTRRAEAMRAHASQIALPGGAVDPGETFEQAALREAHEEVSLKPDAVRVLGRLSPLHIPVSKFVLHPVVGVVDARPTFVPEPQEVARVLEVPLAELGSVEHQRSDRRDFKGQTYVVPFFDVLDERVWGATAMILSEFLTLLERPAATAAAAGARRVAGDEARLGHRQHVARGARASARRREPPYRWS